MFYETMVDELSTIGGTAISDTHSNDDVSFEDEDDTTRRPKASDLGVMDQPQSAKKNIGALNDDSDPEDGYKDFNFENEGMVVGGSGSEKGEPI